MKKVLFILSILVMGLVLVSCGDKEEPVDGAIATLASAKTSLNGVFSDPSNITNNITVPTSLLNGAVTATWTSDEPGVISFGTPDAGLVTGTVNRPALGDGDATVVVTAALSIQSELSTDMLTDTFTITLTVKENTVAEISIETVADILAVVDSEYDGTYNVTIENLSVFAAGDDAVFAYDGTGVIEVYGGASSEMEVGKVYTVAGTIDWYYGLWEITKSTATEQTGATFQAPTKEAITNVSGYIDSLITAGENSHASVADGAFEPIYASITGKVYVIPGDDSNYNTYIISSDATAFTVGSADTPAQGFMVYYHTNNLNDLRLYDGIEVTIDVVIYTYRTNNNAFAIYYVGGADGITANLTDAEKQTIDAGQLSIPASTTEAITLDLPTAGANGSTIAWSFTDSENAANSYVDLATGAVTVPTGEQVTVGITATVSFTGLDDLVMTFEIKIGEYPLSTIAEAIAMGDGATVRVVGIVTDTSDAAGYGAYWLQDATGGFDLFNNAALFTEDMIGKTYEIIGVVDLYNGLWELVPAAATDIVELTGDQALAMPAATDISAMTLDSETLLPYQGTLVDLSGFVLKYDLQASYSATSFTMTFVNAAGQTAAVRIDKDVPGYDTLVAVVAGATAGQAFDFTNVIMSWYNGPQIMIASNSTIAAGTAYTNQQLLDTAAAFLSVPAANAEVTTNLSLPTEGLFNTVVAWTSTNTDVIATDGTVTRPANGAGDAAVTLSYVISLGELSNAAVTIDFTVLEAPANAAVASDLFISEYIEGGSYNKAVEIYNGTGADVDLSIYSIALYSSADGLVPDTPTQQVALSGTLANGDVFVLAHSSATQAILDVADLLNSTVANWNGDDAVGLLKNGVLIDLFGFIGVADPGSYWTVGDGTTADHTFVRDASVNGPTTTFTDSQWVIYAKDDVSYIGSHTMA